MSIQVRQKWFHTHSSRGSQQTALAIPWLTAPMSFDNVEAGNQGGCKYVSMPFTLQTSWAHLDGGVDLTVGPEHVDEHLAGGAQGHELSWGVHAADVAHESGDLAAGEGERWGMNPGRE